MSAEQDGIKNLAYRLWQEGGCPEGRDLDYWLMAEAQLTAEAKPKAAKTNGAAKPKAAAKAAAKPAARPKAAAKTPAKAKVAAKA